MNIKITLPKFQTDNNIANTTSKEQILGIKAFSIENNIPEEFLRIRLFLSKSADGLSPITASIWLWDRALGGQTSLKIKGPHTTDRSVEKCLESLGFKFDKEWSHERIYREIVIQIGKQLGCKNVFVVEI